MKYEPIKAFLGNIFNKQPFFRILFYKLMDLLLLRAWHIKKVIRTWKQNHSSRANILDAGSGFGQYTYYLSSLSPQYTVTGIDILPEQIHDCNTFFTKIKRNDRVQFFNYDITQYQSPNTYDLILSVDVMEHIPDDVQVFRNFYTSLKNNGTLVISTPSDQGGSDVHDHDKESFIAEHVRPGYNIRELEQKLQTAGFDHTDIYYSYGRPGKLAWKLSMKYPIILVNKSKFLFALLPFYYLIIYPIAYVLNYCDVHTKHSTGSGLIAKAYKS